MLLPDPTPQEAADVVAICHLAACYAEAVSRGEVDEAVEVYAEDGVLRSAITADAVGRQAIAATIKEAVVDLEMVFQTVHTGLVRVDGDVARARFPITEWARRRSNGKALQFLGFYDDEARRTAEGWRFSSRLLVGRTLASPSGFDGRIHPLDRLAGVL